MIDISELQGIWFIYDGGCPLCKMAANALRIKQQYGSLHLLNARESANNTLLDEINNRNLNLDEGMIIYHQNQFYHGKDALKFMAVHADKNGFMNRFNRTFFYIDAVVTLFYPLIRAARNGLLKVRRVQKINNLKQ